MILRLRIQRRIRCYMCGSFLFIPERLGAPPPKTRRNYPHLSYLSLLNISKCALKFFTVLALLFSAITCSLAPSSSRQNDMTPRRKNYHFLYRQSRLLPAWRGSDSSPIEAYSSQFFNVDSQSPVLTTAASHPFPQSRTLSDSVPPSELTVNQVTTLVKQYGKPVIPLIIDYILHKRFSNYSTAVALELPTSSRSTADATILASAPLTTPADDTMQLRSRNSYPPPIFPPLNPPLDPYASTFSTYFPTAISTYPHIVSPSNFPNATNAYPSTFNGPTDYSSEVPTAVRTPNGYGRYREPPPPPQFTNAYGGGVGGAYGSNAHAVPPSAAPFGPQPASSLPSARDDSHHHDPYGQYLPKCYDGRLVRRPLCRDNVFSMCPHHEEYPQHLVNKVYVAYQYVIQRMAPVYTFSANDLYDFDSNADTTQVSATRGNYNLFWPDGGPIDLSAPIQVFTRIYKINLCNSRAEYFRPGWARNANGQWVIVVNIGRAFVQKIRSEFCLEPDEQCPLVADCANSWCRQKYTFQPLVTIDPCNLIKGPYMDVFRVPSACECHIPTLP